MVAAPLVCLMFNGVKKSNIFEILWTFSIILESVCVLPQLLLLRQTTVPTVIDSFYLLTLGSYRAFYILNWIYKAFTPNKPDAISIIFGIIQTAFYADFAWVYFTRQRVKLRGGSVVDSDDLRKGWLVNRVIDPRGGANEEDTESQPDGHADTQPRPPSNNRWGARGLSVSADDTLHDHHQGKTRTVGTNESTGMLSNDEAFLSDEDDDVPALDGPATQAVGAQEEWRDEGSLGK